jgi:hypothetical protein
MRAYPQTPKWSVLITDRAVDSSELDQALVQIVRTAVYRSGRLRQSDRPIGHWRCEAGEWNWCLGRKGACLAPPGWFRKIELGRGSTTREVGFGSWLRANDDGSLSIPRYADHVPAPMGPDRHGINVPFDWRPLKRSRTNNTPHPWSFGVALRDEPPNQVAVGMIDCRRSDLGALGVGDRVLCTGWRAWLIGGGIFHAATAFLFVIAFVMLGIAITASARAAASEQRSTLTASAAPQKPDDLVRRSEFTLRARSRHGTAVATRSAKVRR